MRLRAFAAAWTVFTALAAPALLLAQEPAVQAEQPPAPVVPAPAPPAAPLPSTGPAEAPAPDADPAAAAEQPPPPPPGEPAPEPAKPERQAAPAREPRKDAAPRARAAASTTVTIKDFSFSPSSVTIEVGDTVTWNNAGPTLHTATGDGFDTGNLPKGASGSHTFTTAGTFSYICTPHPNMKGTVTVVAAASDGGGATAGEDTTETAADTEDGPVLPDTGAEAWALALLGSGLLAVGFAARRRSDRLSG